MMKKTAVVICNWNKQEDVIQCIESVMASTYEADVIVVDNASTDQSVQAIKVRFGSKVTLIENERNIGGAGGFNTGLRWVLDRPYEYVHLLDNDVVLDPGAIQALIGYLERNPDVAAAGSKLYVMDQPDQLQEMGALIDWEGCHINPHYKGVIDNGELPDMIDCDYVPACSVMIRLNVLREIGLMDESFFIYWDDIEWFFRMKRRGYRVVSLGSSKAWHKMGAADRTTTFPTYYFWRNRVHFFAKYLSAEQVPHFAEQLSREMFNAVFFSSYKGQWKTAQTVLLAVNDALKIVRGKAPEGRIMEREPLPATLEQIVLSRNQVAVKNSANLKVLRDVVNRISAVHPDAKIVLVSDSPERAGLRGQFKALDVLSEVPDGPEWLVCEAVDHILDVRHLYSPRVDLYIDQYGNTVQSERDIRMLNSYDAVFRTYDMVYRPVLEAGIRDLREALGPEAALR